MPQRPGPPAVCVGCEAQRPDCRKTFVGWVCPACVPLLKDVMRWSHDAHRKRPAVPAVRRRAVVTGGG